MSAETVHHAETNFPLPHRGAMSGVESGLTAYIGVNYDRIGVVVERHMLKGEDYGHGQSIPLAFIPGDASKKYDGSRDAEEQESCCILCLQFTRLQLAELVREGKVRFCTVAVGTEKIPGLRAQGDIDLSKVKHRWLDLDEVIGGQVGESSEALEQSSFTLDGLGLAGDAGA